MVLIIFFILLAGGMIFYAKISVYTQAKKEEEYHELDAIAIEQRIRHLAEIQCTIDASVIFDCYDLSKIYALKKSIEDSPLYYSIIVFPNSKVTVNSIYPVVDEIVLYDYTEESMGVEPFRTPVTIYDPREDTYNFGYITIEVYA